ncbi:MAG TPA: hypothetical protein VFO14_01575 [Vicinamibacterales bacterium]|nr:hypothetical protein [Vicinamibacterales bacterium]
MHKPNNPGTPANGSDVVHLNGGTPTGGGGGAVGGVSPDGRINGWPAGSQPPSWQIQDGPGCTLMQGSGVPAPPVGGDGAVGGVSPDGRINGWPGGSQPPSWQTQSGPGTGGLQLSALVGGGEAGACPPEASGFFGDITAIKNNGTNRPARRIVHL